MADWRYYLDQTTNAPRMVSQAVSDLLGAATRPPENVDPNPVVSTQGKPLSQAINEYAQAAGKAVGASVYDAAGYGSGGSQQAGMTRLNREPVLNRILETYRSLPEGKDRQSMEAYSVMKGLADRYYSQAPVEFKQKLSGGTATGTYGRASEPTSAGSPSAAQIASETTYGRPTSLKGKISALTHEMQHAKQNRLMLEKSETSPGPGYKPGIYKDYDYEGFRDKYRQAGQEAREAYKRNQNDPRFKDVDPYNLARDPGYYGNPYEIDAFKKEGMGPKAAQRFYDKLFELTGRDVGDFRNFLIDARQMPHMTLDEFLRPVPEIKVNYP